MDGSSVELINTVSGINGLAVSPSGDEIYWVLSDLGDTIIRRADPDGTNVSDLLVVAGEIPFLAGLSIGAGRLYWSNFSNEIRYATISGTDLGVVLTTTEPVYSIFVDNSFQELYWITIGLPSKIFRAGLDGNSPQLIATSTTDTVFIDVAVSETETIPAVSTWGFILMMLLLLTVGTLFIMRRKIRVS